MYINYINDRQELGFSCIKDIKGWVERRKEGSKKEVLP